MIDWSLVDNVSAHPIKAAERIAKLEAENEKYRLGMQENCKLRKEIVKLEAENKTLKKDDE